MGACSTKAVAPRSTSATSATSSSADTAAAGDLRSTPKRCANWETCNSVLPPSWKSWTCQACIDAGQFVRCTNWEQCHNDASFRHEICDSCWAREDEDARSEYQQERDEHRAVCDSLNYTRNQWRTQRSILQNLAGVSSDNDSDNSEDFPESDPETESESGSETDSPSD
jgi:hypothetical protein